MKTFLFNIFYLDYAICDCNKYLSDHCGTKCFLISTLFHAFQGCFSPLLTFPVRNRACYYISDIIYQSTFFGNANRVDKWKEKIQFSYSIEFWKFIPKIIGQNCLKDIVVSINFVCYWNSHVFVIFLCLILTEGRSSTSSPNTHHV